MDKKPNSPKDKEIEDLSRSMFPQQQQKYPESAPQIAYNQASKNSSGIQQARSSAVSTIEDEANLGTNTGRSASAIDTSSREGPAPGPSNASPQGNRQKQQSQLKQREPTPEKLPTSSMEKVDDLCACLMNAIDHLKLGSALDLPEIVVIGNQSDGKSTMLEAVAKVTLPKGVCTNMCTKCLIRLCIRKGPTEQVKIEFQGKSHDVTDENDVSVKIKELMDEAFPKKETYMDKVIDVKISGPNRQNLTVVDVPGFRHDDPETKIACLEERLKNRNVIIFLVLTAITDIESSKGYGIVQKFDKNFDRTFFVLTHCDNLQQNKQKMVEELLRKGNVFAVNSFSKEGAYNSEEEKAFFNGDQFWKSFPKSKLGIDSLIACMAYRIQLLILPRKNEIYGRIKERLSEFERKQNELKDEKENVQATFSALIRQANVDITAALYGRHPTRKNSLYSNCRKLWDKFGSDLAKNSQELRDKLSGLIDKEMEDQRGWELESVENAFPILVRILKKHLIKPIKPTVKSLISDCELVVETEVANLVKRKIKNHEPLKNLVITKIKDYLTTMRPEVDNHIKTIIEMEEIIFQSDETQQLQDLNKGQATANTGDSTSKEPSGAKSFVAKAGAKFASKLLPPGVDQLAEPAIEAGLGLAVDSLMSAQSEPNDNRKAFLLKKFQIYIDFFELRIANSIPKAIAKFLLHRLAKDIWKVTEKVDESTSERLLSDIDTELKQQEKEVSRLKKIVSDFHAIFI